MIPGGEDSSPVIPVIEEALAVSVEKTITGKVRVSTTTETFDEVVRQELQGMRAEVVRIPIDRTLAPGETPSGTRSEGNVIIIPIFEEVLVVEKRLVLKEELRITQHATSEMVEMPVTLRRQRAAVERTSDETPLKAGENDA